MKMKILKILGLTVILAGLSAHSPKTFAKKSKLREKHFKELKSLEFLVETNVPGTSFKGYLEKSLPIRDGRLVIPHDKITTELELRDQHMYQKIFQERDVTFDGVAKCYKNIKCRVDGTLNIAGKGQKLKFIVKRSGKSFKFTHTVKLTDFNIEIPEFLGVKVQNAIAITGFVR